MTPFLELAGLRKAFPGARGMDTAAVDGIDLTCGEGELVVLLGPSGCGKTTTLRMIAGLERPTAGTIRVAGQDVTRLPPQRRDVGFVFQLYALYPHLTVRDNIAFPLESEGLPRAEVCRRVGDLARRLGLEGLLARRPAGLSGGDRQRVALARALVRQPRLWLMDEPLGTLDADLRLALREETRAQQLELGITTVYVTHDQEEAMGIGDRVVVMDRGRVRQVGAPAEVYDRPADLFVAHFLGSPGMNFIAGRVEGAVDGPARLAASGGVLLPLSAVGSGAVAGDVTLGVRPEFVRPDPCGPLAARVVLEERLGSHSNVHLDTPAGRVVMRRPAGEERAPGDAVRIGFDEDHVRLFRTGSGERLA